MSPVSMTTCWADTPSKHTLAGRARCRLVRRVCRYIIYGWPERGCLPRAADSGHASARRRLVVIT
jgi:hypothetical protein